MNRPLAKQHPKLFQILQKLSTPQLTKLYKLIASLYFHQTAGVKALFVYLRKFHPQYPASKVSNEAIAKHLFPASSNGIKKVKNFKTDLIKLVEQFLILQQLSQQTDQQQLLLTKAYQELQLSPYADRSFKKLQQQLDESPAKGLPYYEKKLQLLHFKYFHPDTPKTFQNAATLQMLLHDLDQYYVAAKYKYTHEVFERVAKIKEQFELPFWENVQAEAPNFGSLNQQSLVYYYQQLQELDSQDAIDTIKFENLCQTFFTHLKYLDREDQLAIYRYLLNYVSKALNNGVAQLKELQFDLFKKGLAYDLIIWKNRIPTNTFLNIVVVATSCKAFAWVEEFIKSNEKYIHPDLQKDVMLISKAFIAFHQGFPDLVITILSDTQFKNFDLELFCLPLETKSMFDIYTQNPTYHTTILSRLESFSRKLSAKYNFSDHKKAVYKNYVYLVKNLVQVFHNPKTDTKEIQELTTKISETNPLIHKSWLLKKCAQIIKLKVI